MLNILFITSFLWPPQYSDADISNLDGNFREIATVIESIRKSIIQLINSSLTSIDDDDLMKEFVSKYNEKYSPNEFSKIQLVHGTSKKLIDMYNMRKALMQLNPSMTTKELDAVLNSLDCNGDSVISGKEFKEWLLLMKQIHKNDKHVDYLKSITQMFFNGSVAEMFAAFVTDSGNDKNIIYKENFINSITLLDRNITKQNLVDLANHLVSNDKVTITFNNITDFLGTSENFNMNIIDGNNDQSDNKVESNTNTNEGSAVSVDTRSVTTDDSKLLEPLTTSPTADSKRIQSSANINNNQVVLKSLSSDKEERSPTGKKQSKNIQSLAPLTRPQQSPITGEPKKQSIITNSDKIDTQESMTPPHRGLLAIQKSDQQYLEEEPIDINSGVAYSTTKDFNESFNMTSSTAGQSVQSNELDDPIHAELLKQIWQNSQDYNLPPPNLSGTFDQLNSSSLSLTNKSIFDKSIPFEEQETNSYIGSSKAVGLKPKDLLQLGFSKHLGKWRGHPYDNWSCCNTSELSCPIDKIPKNKIVKIVTREADPSDANPIFQSKAVRGNPKYVDIKSPRSNINNSTTSLSSFELTRTIPEGKEVNISEYKPAKDPEHRPTISIQQSTRSHYTDSYSNTIEIANQNISPPKEKHQLQQSNMGIQQSEKGIQCNSISTGDQIEALENEIDRLRQLNKPPDSIEASMQTDNTLYDNILYQSKRAMLDNLTMYFKNKGNKKVAKKRPFVVRSVCNCAVNLCNCKPLIMPKQNDPLLKVYSSISIQTDVVMTNKSTQSETEEKATMVDRSNQYESSAVSAGMQTSNVTFEVSVQTQLKVDDQGSQYENFGCDQMSQTEKTEKKEIFIEEKRPPFVVKHVCSCAVKGSEVCWGCSHKQLKLEDIPFKKEIILKKSEVSNREPIHIEYDIPSHPSQSINHLSTQTTNSLKIGMNKASFRDSTTQMDYPVDEVEDVKVPESISDKVIKQNKIKKDSKKVKKKSSVVSKKKENPEKVILYCNCRSKGLDKCWNCGQKGRPNFVVKHPCPCGIKGSHTVCKPSQKVKSDSDQYVLFGKAVTSPPVSRKSKIIPNAQVKKGIESDGDNMCFIKVSGRGRGEGDLFMQINQSSEGILSRRKSNPISINTDSDNHWSTKVQPPPRKLSPSHNRKETITRVLPLFRSINNSIDDQVSQPGTHAISIISSSLSIITSASPPVSPYQSMISDLQHDFRGKVNTNVKKRTTLGKFNNLIYPFNELS